MKASIVYLWVAGGLLGMSALAQDASPLALSFTIEDQSVQFTWPGSSDLVLQRSTSLEGEAWDSILATRGQSSFVDQRQDQAVFYRLSSLGIPINTIRGLEQRVTELTVNQIERALNPRLASDTTLGPVPPVGEAEEATHSLTLFGKDRPFTWATQPGLIRIYNDNPNGFSKAFKLYSSDDSVASSTEELLEDIDKIRTWQEHPDQFADLNEPIVEDGESHYPILDPRIQVGEVEGFSFQQNAELGSNPGTALPMPAQWLYLLRDGSMGSLSNDNHWQGEGTPTADNPMVGRVAYWADDESTKLNVNVASEGIPWDQPRADTPLERNYAHDQPVTREVQRYPGHPAMTSMSSLLFPGKAANHLDPNKRLNNDELSLIYSLTPRVVARGESASALEFDDDPLYESIDDWADAAEAQGISHASRLHGLVTTRNPSPETTIHGTPRISLWPVHERPSGGTRTAYDTQSAELATLNDQLYYFARRDSTSRHGELYTRGSRRNITLYDSLVSLTYRETPGYGASLARKYGARLQTENYRNILDYDKDHYAIALSMMDRMRTTNLLDPNLEEPYSQPDRRGQLPGLNLIGRNLETDNGSSQQAGQWNRPTLEPQGAGRNFIVSEVAMVAYVTSDVTISGWDDTSNTPAFSSEIGSTSDVRVTKRILSNEHPEYSSWMGRSFSKDDVGKTFVSIEVGMIPEVFSPTPRFPRVDPLQSLRLMKGGIGYRGGLSLEKGLKVNNIPLLLWGHSGTSPQTGPVIATRDPQVPQTGKELPDLPEGWPATTGYGGDRLFRFGLFTISPEDEGFFGTEFLANGSGPLHGWYCQNLVVVEKGQDLNLTQQEPIQILSYNHGMQGASTGNLIHTTSVRFAAPGESLTIPAPGRNSAEFSGWTRRFRSASQDPDRPLLDPQGSHAVKGITLSHGDFRHIAVKRHVPSELFTHHPLAVKERSSHSLKRASQVGLTSEPGATFGPTVFGRSLVKGVNYNEHVLPDFTGNPSDRQTFAPLLGADYQFPIDPTITRDFDNGLGNTPDGPYMNAPDDGDDRIVGDSPFAPIPPYFNIETVRDFDLEPMAAEHHFARRMVISPVDFGSIPSAAQANAPWTCLLFRPNLSDPVQFPHLGEAGNGMQFHSNRETLEGFDIPQMASVTDPRLPPDHLWLDYFWMPTVEPAHISSPLATQGKVNMNYQLFPYTYIHRATALHAVFKAEEIMAIPTSAGPTYKTSQNNPNWRHRIDANETLKQFEARFAQGEIFKTESEICEQFLIPEGETWDDLGESIRAFWDQHRLSGDNTMERPYSGLYARLTTRSNAFRLHYRVQIIGKSESVAPERFDASLDEIIEEQRGSKVLERVLNVDKGVPRTRSIAREFDFQRIEESYDTIVRDL